MSIKYYDEPTYGSFVITMAAFAGGREVLNNVRVAFNADPVKGTPRQQLLKFVDWLDRNSEGHVKYVRSALGYPVMDKPGYDIGVAYKKGLIGVQNPTSTMHKQWINIPFLKPDVSNEDVKAMAQEIKSFCNLSQVLRTPGMNDNVVIIPTQSVICAKSLQVGKDPADYDNSGQTFDDDGADEMGGSAA